MHPSRSTRSRGSLNKLRNAPLGLDHYDLGGIRHNFGATCVGADLSTLGGRLSTRSGPPPFLRPCQTLEAYQRTLSPRAVRRRCIPEAEVARAALHMLQGLGGEIFELLPDNGGGDACGTSNRRGLKRFALSAFAARDLGVASLSPAALSSVLDDFVSLGCTAQYLRDFIADAADSALHEARSSSVVSAATRRRLPNSAGADGAPRVTPGGRASSKHGHTTQVRACKRCTTQIMKCTVFSPTLLVNVVDNDQLALLCKIGCYGVQNPHLFGGSLPFHIQCLLFAMKEPGHLSQSSDGVHTRGHDVQHVQAGK